MSNYPPAYPGTNPNTYPGLPAHQGPPPSLPPRRPVSGFYGRPDNAPGQGGGQSAMQPTYSSTQSSGNGKETGGFLKYPPLAGEAAPPAPADPYNRPPGPQYPNQQYDAYGQSSTPSYGQQQTAQSSSYGQRPSPY